MKKIMLFLACIAAGAAALAQSEPPCNCYSLSGTISTNTTLNQPCYHLTGCVNVTSGHTLTINAGTQIFADEDASLVIEQGAYIIAQGAVNNPIIFTTDQAASSRTPGYWKGITIAGNATDNDAGFTLSRNCANISAGGMNDADSSGVIQYVQIHYAGGQASGEDEVNGLTLAAVGSKTKIDHIEVSYSEQEGFAFLGGTVNAKYLVSYNNYGNDVKTDRGYRGLMQHGLLVRRDNTAHRSISPNSNGLYSINDAANSTNTPKTQPVFSNFSIIGPGYCGATGLSSDFRNGVLFAKNTEARIYNSLIAGWDVGFRIEDQSTIQNANNNASLFFSDNTFYNNLTTPFNLGGTWTSPGCESSMSAWINIGNLSPQSCAMINNEAMTSGLGYAASVCNDYCSSTPSFALSSTSMSAPDYSYADLQTAFFDAASYRGGVQGTDWTSGWAEWCPEDIDYCNDLRSAAPSYDHSLLLQPNPARSVTYAIFHAPEGLKLNIQVLDQVTGKIIREVSYRSTPAGEQKVAIPVSGLRSNVYLVQILLPDGTRLAAQLATE